VNLKKANTEIIKRKYKRKANKAEWIDPIACMKPAARSSSFYR